MIATNNGLDQFYFHISLCSLCTGNPSGVCISNIFFPFFKSRDIDKKKMNWITCMNKFVKFCIVHVKFKGKTGNSDEKPVYYQATTLKCQLQNTDYLATRGLKRLLSKRRGLIRLKHKASMC